MLSAEEKDSIIAELNSKFTELRSLIITVGSIIGILMAGLHNAGFIDWAVDSVVDSVEDDPEWNPYIEDCEEEFILITDHFIVESDVIFNVLLEDINRCSRVHTIMWRVSLNDDAHIGESGEFRNELLFTDRYYDLDEGNYHAIIEVSNGTIELYDYITIDFEYDETEQENAEYGCTDTVALNYNETATHDDGSCEYEQEEVEDCSAAEMGFYDVYTEWTNNTTFMITWDADVSIECSLNATVTAHVYDNETLVANSSRTFETFYQAWDYMYINFTAPSGKDSFGELRIVVVLISDAEFIWEERELWN